MNSITLNQLFNRDRISSARIPRYRIDKIVNAKDSNDTTTKHHRVFSVILNNTRNSIFDISETKIKRDFQELTLQIFSKHNLFTSFEFQKNQKKIEDLVHNQEEKPNYTFTQLEDKISNWVCFISKIKKVLKIKCFFKTQVQSPTNTKGIMI